MQYTKAQINSNIRKTLEYGRSNAEALDLYLKMNMENDLDPERPFIWKGPSLAEIHMNLIGNHVIDKDDFKLEVTKNAKIPVQRLVVRLSPTCTIYVEEFHSILHVTINETILTGMYLKSYQAEDVAQWLIRQKQNLEKYMEGWDDVLAQACKKAKSNHLAFLGIRASVIEAMKEYPRIKYEIVEQKQRAKIMVKIPHTHLGVTLYAWWGSYREELPKQIESLKQIIDVYSKSTITNYFIYH